VGSWAGRALVAALLIVISVALQLTVLSSLPLPGATPDLLTVVVCAWALRRGSLEGAIVGFAGGLAMDLAPPTDGPLGLTALVLAVVGYGVGLVADESERSAFAPLIITVLASLVALVLWAGLALLVGDVRVTGSAVAGQLFAQALYTAVMAPFVLPLVHALLSRVEPTVTRW
jgi:rod shape-determining protein MreD